MREAEDHFVRGEYLEALGDYQEVLERTKTGEQRARALMMSATIYGTFLKDYESALPLYNQVRERYSGSVYEADAIFQTAAIQYERARYREASRLFSLYLEKFPAGSKKDVASFLRDASDNPPSEKERKEREQGSRQTGGASIRVLVLENATGVGLSGTAPLQIKSPDSRILTTLNASQEARIRCESGLLSVNGTAYPFPDLLLAVDRGGQIRLNGAWYRGVLRLSVTDKGRLRAINITDLEDYLYGVVPQEMPPGWPEEALKAQAIVSRTFARYQMAVNAAREYDISATTASQVYGGIAAETDKTRRAVDATRGRILTFNGRPALTYFHANSGGVTEDARNVWRVAIPYLQSVSDDYSARAPGVMWTAFLSYDQICEAMTRNGLKVERISDVETVAHSPSGRAVRMKITHGAGTTVVGGNEFRMMTDPARIKSTLFKLDRNSQGIRFEGRGLGHGVGLSQWGARIMAEGGSPCREILLHYYRGLELN